MAKAVTDSKLPSIHRPPSQPLKVMLEIEVTGQKYEMIWAATTDEMKSHICQTSFLPQTS